METGDLAAGALELGLYELLRQRLLQPVLIPSPVAGAEWSASPPSGCLWEVLSARALLTTSAVVAARAPAVRHLDPNGNEILRVNIGNTLAASLSAGFNWAAGLGDHNASNGFTAGLPLPGLIVPAGWTVGSSTSNLDVADAYTQVRLLVREWSLLEVAQAGEWYGHRQWPM